MTNALLEAWHDGCSCDLEDIVRIQLPHKVSEEQRHLCLLFFFLNQSMHFRFGWIPQSLPPPWNYSFHFEWNMRFLPACNGVVYCAVANTPLKRKTPTSLTLFQLLTSPLLSIIRKLTLLKVLFQRQTAALWLFRMLAAFRHSATAIEAHE